MIPQQLVNIFGLGLLFVACLFSFYFEIYLLERASNKSSKTSCGEVLLHNPHNTGSMLPLHYWWRVLKARLITGRRESALCSVTFFLHALHIHQLLHVVGIVEPQLHADKGFPSLQTQLVPGLGASQQVWDRALCQPQDCLPEQTLT